MESSISGYWSIWNKGRTTTTWGICDDTPPKLRVLTCPVKRDYFGREYIWTNHWFSGDMLVFRGHVSFHQTWKPWGFKEFKTTTRFSKKNPRREIREIPAQRSHRIDHGENVIGKLSKKWDDSRFFGTFPKEQQKLSLKNKYQANQVVSSTFLLGMGTSLLESAGYPNISRYHFPLAWY